MLLWCGCYQGWAFDVYKIEATESQLIATEKEEEEGEENQIQQTIVNNDWSLYIIYRYRGEAGAKGAATIAYFQPSIF